MAILGVCGGFVQPLRAEPPQSREAQRPARAEASASGRDITVTGQPPVTIGGTPARTPCAAGDTTGRVTAGAADCAATKLQDAASAAQHAANIDPTLAVPNARSGDTVVGVGSLTGSSQRYGVDLRGRTTLPTRPAPPPPPTSPFARRP